VRADVPVGHARFAPPRLTSAVGHAEHRPRPGKGERLTDGYAGANRRCHRWCVGHRQGHRLLLARQGARVLIGDIDQAGGRIAAAEDAAERLAIDYLLLDLADKPSIDAFAADVHQRVARVDGLVNEAGWNQIQPFLENPPEMWDRVIAVNLMGAADPRPAAPDGGSECREDC
jgi:hypothetical protein